MVKAALKKVRKKRMGSYNSMVISSQYLSVFIVICLAFILAMLMVKCSVLYVASHTLYMAKYGTLITS